MGIGGDSVRVRPRTGPTPGELGFTLTELMIVVGLIALLAALLLPVVGRMRAASGAVQCAANLRQMGTAWSVYTTDNDGRFMDYVWQTPPTPGVAWNNYWPGILDRAGVRGSAILCPAAVDPAATTANRGYGSAAAAWTGKASANGTCIKFDASRFRDGSYGYNRYLTVGGGFGGERMSAMRTPSDVPVFLDAAYVDVRPTNGSESSPVASPPNLRGDTITPGSPDHWLFLLARHGRGVNCLMADGSVRWVILDDLYSITWKANWAKYRLELPNS